MKSDELASKAADATTVRRVFGDPYVQDGVTVIAAAHVAGGAGGGGGHDQGGQEGEGGGFGVRCRPAGAYVIRDGQVRWMPAVDVNKVLAGIAVVLLAFFVTRARVEKARASVLRAGA